MASTINIPISQIRKLAFQMKASAQEPTDTISKSFEENVDTVRGFSKFKVLGSFLLSSLPRLSLSAPGEPTRAMHLLPPNPHVPRDVLACSPFGFYLQLLTPVSEVRLWSSSFSVR